MEKLYYSISEVADILGESISLVRFWSNSFPKYVKPTRTAKGNRQYKPGDIEALKQIHYLVKEKGMTLDGAEKQLREQRKSVESPVKAINVLKSIREQLVEIRETL